MLSDIEHRGPRGRHLVDDDLAASFPPARGYRTRSFSAMRHRVLGDTLTTQRDLARSSQRRWRVHLAAHEPICGPRSPK